MSKMTQRWVEGGTGFSPNYLIGGLMGAVNFGVGVYFLYFSISPWLVLNFFLALIFVCMLKECKPGAGDSVIEVKGYDISFDEIMIGAGVATIALVFLFILFVIGLAVIIR